MPRLVVMATRPETLRAFARDQLAYFRKLGYDVVAIASPGPDLNFLAEREGVKIIGIPMRPQIAPLADFVSLMRMYRTLRQIRPDIVNAGTTKAAFIGLLAARLARVPVRIYTLHGLRLETTHGLKRRVLSSVERITSACVHRIIAVSHSVARLYAQLGLSRPEKLRVLGIKGSTNGLNASRYAKTAERIEKAADLRRTWNISAQTPLIGFVGRFVRDKGVVDLIEAFDIVLQEIPEAKLLMVGDFEAGDPVPDAYQQRIQTDPRILKAGFVEDVAPYYAAMDLLAFPTHREGFGYVAIEGGAAGLPVVGYQVTGMIDLVINDVTGTLVPLGDHKALAAAIIKYLKNTELRKKHGDAGRERAEQDFRPEMIWQALDEQYRELLAAAGR